MAGMIHEIAVHKVLGDFPDAQTRGLMRAIRAAIPDRDEGDFEGHFGAIPDAFLIDHDRDTVLIFEVEDSSPVSAAKMEIYTDLFWVLDWYSWSLVLVTLDRWGNYCAEFDAASYAATKLVIEAEKNPRKPRRSPEMAAWVQAIKDTCAGAE